YMDRGCNYNCGYGDVGAMLRYFFSKKQKKELPTIIHFMGASKPWLVSYYGKFGERYYQFLKPYLEGREKWQFSVRYLYKANALLHTAVKILRGRGEKWER
ncbi:MAG: hypothetical protein LUI07_09910, partial [Lachnospiraceae bacterium]|nr:hypothetical protein [Lachnospiraceae bacterium]